VPFMSRVTSLTSMPEAQLNRWIKRIGLLLIIGIVAFVGFYVADRYRLPQTPIVDRQLTALEDAVRAKPDDIPSRGQLADLYVAKGRYADAITQYDMIINSGKADAAAHLGRGEANRLSGQFAAAATDYQAVIDLLKDTEQAVTDPVLQAAYFGLGSVLLSQDRAADAVKPLENAVALKGSDADAIYLLGAAYLGTGDSAKAIETLKRSIEFVPIGWADPYTALAGAYTKAGDAAHAEWAAAMADVSSGQGDTAETRLKALMGGPAALDAAIGLGLIYETRGDTASAGEWYTKALTIDPSSKSATLGIGRVAPISPPAPAPSTTTASPAPSAPPSGQIPGGNS
jgi:tetratricopeptide (TPR) repeat protein